MNTLTGQLAEEEFAFRYLALNQATTHVRSLDALEQEHQFRPLPGAAPAGPDLAPLFRTLVAGQTPGGDVRQRLLAALLQAHLPGCVTPLTGYGLHASYPSPRAYYPLQFILEEGATGGAWHVDMEAMRLQPQAGAAADGDAPFTLLIKTNFRIYAPLYNLFRKSLFALECGHFLSEFLLLADALGLHVTPQLQSGAIRLALRDAGAPATPDPLAAHRHFARERNSGRFFQGFYPAPSSFCDSHLDRLTGNFRAALQEIARLFPSSGRLRLSAKLCLRASPGVAPGIYRLDAGGLTCLSAQDPLAQCERLYNYTAFNFRHVPAIVFLCVDELAYACADTAFLEMNMVLGYLSQQLIRGIWDGEMLGRPFRSYDQLGIDRLLQNADDGLRSYYGLMLARNRCSDALGMLR